MNCIALFLFALVYTNYIFTKKTNLVHGSNVAVKELSFTKEQLGKSNNYTQELLHLQIKLNDSWNKTKELVQESLTANQIPAADIFQPARKQIMKEVSLFSKEDAENCIQHTEDQFILLYNQVAESMLNCVSSKSRKVLISLDDLEDALQDGIDRINYIRKKIILCQIKTGTEKAACQQLHLTTAQKEEATGVQLMAQVNAVLVAAEALPPKIMTCTEHLLKYLSGQAPKIVKSVQDCKK